MIATEMRRLAEEKLKELDTIARKHDPSGYGLQVFDFKVMEEMCAVLAPILSTSEAKAQEAGGEADLLMANDALREARDVLIRNGLPDLPFLCDGIQNAIDTLRTPHPIQQPVAVAGDAVRAVLLRHHQWQKTNKAACPEFGFSYAAEYAESGLCEDTEAALAQPPAQAVATTSDTDERGGPLTYWGGLAKLAQPCAPLKPAVELKDDFQSRVAPWMQDCFGPAISADTVERTHRFLEEALELVQACGATREECLQLVDYVYGRPVGEPSQEVGGVMVTLAALCLANGIDMHQAGETELARIWTKIEQIRAKQAAKPKNSLLPQAVETDTKSLRETDHLGQPLTYWGGSNTAKPTPLLVEEWADATMPRTFTREEIASFITPGDHGIIATLARQLLAGLEEVERGQ